jgi:hypothetical protein
MTRGDEVRERPPAPRRRASWNKSYSDSFGPIKQVGVAVSVGVPLLVVGLLFVMVLIFSLVGIGHALWILGAGILLVGLLAALSGRVI